MDTDPAPESVIPEWTIGERLHKVRRHLGLSQIEFAERLNTNAKNIGAWEINRNIPRDIVNLARQVQRATGVPAWWMLGLDDDPGGGATNQPTLCR